MKTAVTVLQEMMVKMGKTPEYKNISQSGPQHLTKFECQCNALGVTVSGWARSKKEAKQEVARIMLQALSRRGYDVPPPYNQPRSPSSGCTSPNEDSVEGSSAGPSLGSHSYVALLRELCEEYRLPAVEYLIVSDTGPPHCRQFTIRASFVGLERFATAPTKKAAKQHSAQQLYTYLRENLSRLTNDFDESEALVRVHEKVMERYVETREDQPWRPDLGQKTSTYHYSLFAHIDADTRNKAIAALDTLSQSQEQRQAAFDALAGLAEPAGEPGAGDAGAGPSPASPGSPDPEAEAERDVIAVARALGLTVKWSTLPSMYGPKILHVLELTPTMPEVTTAGATRSEAAQMALRFLRLSLLSGARAYPGGAPQPAPRSVPVPVDDLIRFH